MTYTKEALEASDPLVRTLMRALEWDWPGDSGVPSADECLEPVAAAIRADFVVIDRERESEMSKFSQAALVGLSEWIDAGNAHRDPEAVTWGRLAKLAEEQGEVIEAYIGATGQNPRKGVTCSMEKVLEELLDVAVTALGAFEHIDGHQGRALSELDDKIVRVAERAGVIPNRTIRHEEESNE